MGSALQNKEKKEKKNDEGDLTCLTERSCLNLHNKKRLTASKSVVKNAVLRSQSQDIMCNWKLSFKSRSIYLAVRVPNRRFDLNRHQHTRLIHETQPSLGISFWPSSPFPAFPPSSLWSQIHGGGAEMMPWGAGGGVWAASVAKSKYFIGLSVF